MRSVLVLSFFSFSLLSCNGGSDNSGAVALDNQELGQEVGNIMSSIDEFGSSVGSFTFLQSAKKTYARYGLKESRSWVLPQASAAMCKLGSTFGTCTDNVITRTFDACTIGTVTFRGTVTLTFTDSAVDTTCSLAADGNTIFRNPNFTMTGRRGATLTVASLWPDTQTITRTGAGVFTFLNLEGVRRDFTNANDVVLFDLTTKVDSPITITGQSRGDRVMDGGNMNVTNNKTNEVCNIVPSAVTWDGSCNCATSGAWSGTCSKSGDFGLTINSCTEGTLIVGDSTETVTFDRCYATN